MILEGNIHMHPDRPILNVIRLATSKFMSVHYKSSHTLTATDGLSDHLTVKAEI